MRRHAETGGTGRLLFSSRDAFIGRRTDFFLGGARVRSRLGALSRWGFVVAAIFTGMLPNSGRADLVIKQRVDGGQTGEMTVQIKDGKTRADLAQAVSMITDAAGDTIVLQHSQKTYVRMPASQTKALTEQILKAQANAGAPKLDATGQQQVIGGHDCELYVWSLGALRMRFWVAKNYPGAAKIQLQLDQLQNQGLGAIAASMMPKAADLPGIRLRTELDAAGQRITYTIISITDVPVDPAVFEIPKGYREAPMSLGPSPSE